MTRCWACKRFMLPDLIRCLHCGAVNPDREELAVGGGITKARTTTLDKVEAVDIERIWTGGVWDEAWSGFVPSSATLLGSPAGCGKALALDTPIPTPTGWSTMGELRLGDIVFDEHGRQSRVEACSKVMFGHDCYEVVFSDGERIVADADHLWVTQSTAERESIATANNPKRRFRRRHSEIYNPKLATKKKKLSISTVRTTRELKDTLTIGHYGRKNHAVRMAGPLLLQQASLPIAPYTLGVWLGDGATTAGSYYNLDTEIADRIRAEGYIVKRHDYDQCPKWTVYGLQKKLRVVGLLGNKHIPSLYLRASIPQRLELLRGLMDTDGDCAKTGGCCFTTTLQPLMNGMCDLLASLGVKFSVMERRAMLYGKDCGPAWRFHMSSDFGLFTLNRKADRQRGRERGMQRRRYILEVNPVQSVPVKCIKVDSESETYLAGRKMVPTHNTTLCMQVAEIMAKMSGKRAYYLSAEQSPGEIKLTTDRLKLDPTRFRVLTAMGGGADIDAGLLKEDPPACFIVDSVSALCGQKDLAGQLLVVKSFKKLAVKYNAPAFLISHVTKSQTFAGLESMQHEPDVVMTFDMPDKKEEAELLEQGVPEELLKDTRSLIPWKNRFGVAHRSTYLVMTEHGLVALPKKEDKTSRPRTATPPPPSPIATEIGERFHPMPPDEIESDGQRLIRKKKKSPKPARAEAIEGSATKKGRPEMQRTPEGKRAARERRKKTAA